MPSKSPSKPRSDGEYGRPSLATQPTGARLRGKSRKSSLGQKRTGESCSESCRSQVETASDGARRHGGAFADDQRSATDPTPAGRSQREAGFDLALIAARLGLPESVFFEPKRDVEGCPTGALVNPCHKEATREARKADETESQAECNRPEVGLR